MKKIIFTSGLLLLNFIFQSTLKAQDSKKQITALLDSIKNCYTGLTDYTFSYGVGEPQQQKSKGDTTSFSMEQKKNCDAPCLCHSYLMYKGPDKEYLELFPISSLKIAEFHLEGNILFLEKAGDGKRKPSSMSHPDAVKILKIKNWLEELTKYCSGVTVEPQQK